MVAWRSTYASVDVNVNNYESLHSEYEDKSLSLEQLKISQDVGFIGIFKRFDSKIEF